MVLNISDPTNLREIGSPDIFNGVAQDVVIISNIAFVAIGGGGLYLINISYPHNPMVLGVYDTMDYGEEVSISGQYDYFANGLRGFIALNISNSSQPVRVRTIYILNYVFDVSIKNQYAYLAVAK